VENGTAKVTRLPVPHDAPEGFRWVAVVEADPAWALAEPGKTCRQRMPGGRAHGVPATVRKRIGITRVVGWNFCPEHADGHWAEDGRVYHWEPRLISRGRS
jgi:hypothetical protein